VDALQTMTTFDFSQTSKLSHDGISHKSSDIWLLLGHIALGSIFVVSGFGKLTHLGGHKSESWMAAPKG